MALGHGDGFGRLSRRRDRHEDRVRGRRCCGVGGRELHPGRHARRPKLHGGIERGVSRAAESGEDDPDRTIQPGELAQRAARGAVRVEETGQHRRLAEHVLEQRAGPVGRHEVAIRARIPSVGAHSHSGRYVAAYTNS